MKWSWNMIWPLKFANSCFLLQIMPHFFNLTIEHHTAGSSAGDYEVGDPIAIALLSLDAVGVLHLPPEKTFQLRGNNFSKYPGEILELFGKHPMTLGHTWARNQLKDGFTGFPDVFSKFDVAHLYWIIYSSQSSWAHQNSQGWSCPCSCWLFLAKRCKQIMSFGSSERLT